MSNFGRRSKPKKSFILDYKTLESEDFIIGYEFNDYSAFFMAPIEDSRDIWSPSLYTSYPTLCIVGQGFLAQS